MTRKQADDGGKWLSVPAMLWAMDDAPGVPTHLVSTLLVYARYADEDGRGAYPGGATVARLARKSKAQANRDAAELEQLGLLLPGDQGLVKDIRADRRPKVYDLAMPRGASSAPRSPERGASTRPVPGASSAPRGPERGAYSPRTRRMQPSRASLNNPEKSSSSSSEQFPGRAPAREAADLDGHAESARNRQGDDDDSETRSRPDPGPGHGWCGVCGKRYRVGEDGLLQDHGPRRGRCKGSRQRPADARKAAR